MPKEGDIDYDEHESYYYQKELIVKSSENRQEPGEILAFVFSCISHSLTDLHTNRWQLPAFGFCEEKEQLC